MVRLSEIMELDLEMSTLHITAKKRRLSGLINPKTEPYLSTLHQSPENMARVAKEPTTSTRKSTRTIKQSIKIFDKPPIETKPKPKLSKLNLTTDVKEIKKIYMKKSLKPVNPSLETIFEDPVNEKIMSVKKLKRAVNFGEAKKLKTKKRVMKAKNVRGKKKIKKMSMKSFMEKLADMDSDIETI